MTLPGETILTGAPTTCPDCGVTLEFQVCNSAAGYYIGTFCNCGPYTRESGYFPSWELANAALEMWGKGEYPNARTTEFQYE